jgi:hypothetical protein
VGDEYLQCFDLFQISWVVSHAADLVTHSACGLFDFLSSLSIEDLESWRDTFNLLLITSTLAVCIGVHFEKDGNPHAVQEYGWALVRRGIAIEFALAILLWQLDSVIGTRHKADIASLFDRATKAELELEKIKQPGTISDDKKETLTSCLRASPKGKVYIRPSMLDTDGPLLAKQLEDIFKATDFQTPIWPEGPSMAWSKAGIFLIAHQLTNVQPHISAVQRCLFSVGIEARADVDPKHPEDAVSIGIGPRL